MQSHIELGGKKSRRGKRRRRSIRRRRRRRGVREIEKPNGHSFLACKMAIKTVKESQCVWDYAIKSQIIAAAAFVRSSVRQNLRGDNCNLNLPCTCATNICRGKKGNLSLSLAHTHTHTHTHTRTHTHSHSHTHTYFHISTLELQ